MVGKRVKKSFGDRMGGGTEIIGEVEGGAKGEGAPKEASQPDAFHDGFALLDFLLLGRLFFKLH